MVFVETTKHGFQDVLLVGLGLNPMLSGPIITELGNSR